MTAPVKLSANDAKRIILLILEEGTIELSFHCRSERMQARGVTMLDLVTALKNGEIRREPEWDEERYNWKYRVEGKDIEGDDLIAITIIIDAEMELFIVTVF
jgi:Domain of unknown function (DUF4258)